jgi:hypothetical protein
LKLDEKATERLLKFNENKEVVRYVSVLEGLVKTVVCPCP